MLLVCNIACKMRFSFNNFIEVSFLESACLILCISPCSHLYVFMCYQVVWNTLDMLS